MLTATPTNTSTAKAQIFRGLSDPSRLSIFEALRNGRRSASEIVETIGYSQSDASKHLACRFDCELVVREQQGRFVDDARSDHRFEESLMLADRPLTDVAREVRCCTRYTSDYGDHP